MNVRVWESVLSAIVAAVILGTALSGAGVGTSISIMTAAVLFAKATGSVLAVCVAASSFFLGVAILTASMESWFTHVALVCATAAGVLAVLFSPRFQQWHRTRAHDRARRDARHLSWRDEERGREVLLTRTGLYVDTRWIPYDSLDSRIESLEASNGTVRAVIDRDGERTRLELSYPPRLDPQVRAFVSDLVVGVSWDPPVPA